MREREADVGEPVELIYGYLRSQVLDGKEEIPLTLGTDGVKGKVVLYTSL